MAGTDDSERGALCSALEGRGIEVSAFEREDDDIFVNVLFDGAPARISILKALPVEVVKLSGGIPVPQGSDDADYVRAFFVRADLEAAGQPPSRCRVDPGKRATLQVFVQPAGAVACGVDQVSSTGDTELAEGTAELARVALEAAANQTMQAPVALETSALKKTGTSAKGLRLLGYVLGGLWLVALMAAAAQGRLAGDDLSGLGRLAIPLTTLGLIPIVGLLYYARLREGSARESMARVGPLVAALKACPIFDELMLGQQGSVGRPGVIQAGPWRRDKAEANVECDLLLARSEGHGLELEVTLYSTVWPLGTLTACKVLPDRWAVLHVTGPKKLVMQLPSFSGEERSEESLRWQLSESELDRGELTSFLERLSALATGGPAQPYR